MASRTMRTLVCGAACVWASAAFAQQNDSLLKNAMKLLGFATDVGQPPDFVVNSRPKDNLDYIPVFQPPPEPAKPALKDKELNDLKSDLDSVQKRDDGVRQAFPPSAKAVAEQAQQKQSQQKKAKTTRPAANQ
jgi:hypothetical protein